MRIVAIVLNLILISVVAFLFVTEGAPNNEEWLFVMLIIASPICSIIALLGSIDGSWLSLYLTRKALEEKKKIKALNDGDKS